MKYTNYMDPGTVKLSTSRKEFLLNIKQAKKICKNIVLNDEQNMNCLEILRLLLKICQEIASPASCI